ncbi:prolipoprotein diacylglyceryl transferase, partial [Candidatus Woesearchaeota archaeon]|nr:prolipoprotein diacylglyceryl transferase [Candidatus Woesearchaeota archaeon]
SIPFMFIGGLIKIANFINAELVGKITGVSWCVYFPGYNSCRHPQQLYSAARFFALFGWLLFLARKDHKEGFIFWNMIAGYGLLRLLLDFFREDATFLGLSTGQYLSLVMFILGAVVLIKYYQRDLKNIFSRKA